MHTRSEIETAVNRIFEHLRRLDAPVGNRRRPGADVAKITSSMAEFGLTPSDDFKNLYACCDGTETHTGERLGDIQFIPGYYWMNFQEALSTYISISGDDRWNNAWFPFMGNGGGDFYAVISDRNSRFFGEIVGFIVDEEQQIAEFESIESLFKIIDHSFEQGIFSSAGDRLTADFPKMRTIARDLQPHFEEHDVQ